MKIKNILGYIILLLHELLPIITILLLLFSNNIIIINVILILLILTLYQWYIFNDCLAYPLIDWLFDKNINNNILHEYYTINFCGKNIKILKVILCSFHLYVNFILVFISIIKINYIYYKKIKKIKKRKKVKKNHKRTNDKCG
jgi:hypothetical protein